MNNIQKDLQELNNILSYSNEQDKESKLKKDKQEHESNVPVPQKEHPIIKRNSTGKIIEIEVSSSIITRFMYHGERIEICPQKEYRNTVLKDLRTPTTLSQLKGLFFETLCIGGSANGNSTNDLPRKPNGDKTVDQIRIEEQALVFDHVCNDSGIEIIKHNTKDRKKNVQIRNKVEWVDNLNIPILEGVKIIVKMESDIISPVYLEGYNFDIACIDLKATRDRESTYSKYGWGNPENRDHIQGYIYSWMLKMPFVYLIFDYKSKNMGYKFLPINTNVNHSDSIKANEAKLRLRTMHQSIRQTVVDILNYDNIGWHTEPSYERCKDCPILDCKDKQRIQEY